MAFRAVLARHADEAAALWPRRERAAGATDVGLAELARLDRRIEAHLDGLRLAGKEGSKVVAGLDVAEEGVAFTAAAQALARRDAKALAGLLDATQADQDLTPGLMSALAWVPLDQSEWAVRAMLHERCPAPLRRFGLSAHVAQRSDPGLPLIDAMAASAAPLRATALEGAALLGRAELLPDIVTDLDSESTPCRLAARLAAALLGDPRAPELLWDQASSDTPAGRAALVVAIARSTPEAAGRRLDGWRDDRRHRRAAVEGIGLLGESRYVPWLLEDMRRPELARLAAHAFSRITGVAIEGPLAGGPLEGAPTGPDDDPEHEDVAPDADAALAWPVPDAVDRKWTEVRRTLPQGRLLMGAPLDLARCDRALQEGSQRLRSELAWERALMTPGRPVVSVRAPGFRQLLGARLGAPAGVIA
jgi:uncharacterized protein (TIGR02270 family)